jgi:hypothetical protein
MKPFAVRLPFAKGRILFTDDNGEALLTAGTLFDTNLRASVVHRDGAVDELDLGSGLVTTAGVNFMATDFFDGSTDISTFDFHHTGIGTTAAAIGDTTLENVTGVPARVSGTPSNPSANQYRSVATVSYTSSLAITEWGLFSASSGGTLWDRRVFSPINVVSGDSIQFTYTLTINAGG